MALLNMNPEYKLDFWQKWYIESNKKFLIVNKSRRVGWSYITSAKGVIEAIDPEIQKYQLVYVSYGMHDALNKISDARNFLMNLPDKYHKKMASDSKTQLEFWDTGNKSKSSLISLPNRTLRGFGTANPIGGVCLDEFAYHSDDDKVYISVLPCLTRGGLLSIGSTPASQAGMFYNILSDEKHYPDFKRITIPWWWSSAICIDVPTAINTAPAMMTHERVETFGTPILKQIHATMSLSSFQQEYECQFVDEAEAFISLELIMGCTPRIRPEIGEFEQYEYRDISEMVNGAYIDAICTGLDDSGNPMFESVSAPGYSPDKHGILYAGYDIGRTKDSSIFTLIGSLNGKKHIWMTYELKKTDFDKQRAFVELAMDSLPIRVLNIDQTGLGREFAEWAEKRFPTRAYGCTFTNESKEDMANAMYLGFERKEFILPMNPKLHADIHCIRRTMTQMKHNKYDGSTKDSHADRFWSMALANIAVSDSVQAKSRFYEERKQMQTGTRKTGSTGNKQLDLIIRRGRR
jgi:phage FluMu gp28-like protein